MATENDESTWINAQYKKSKPKAKIYPMGGSLEEIENYWRSKDKLFFSNSDEVLTMSVSNCYIGRIIGKFGKKIKEIESSSGAIIRIERDTKDFDKNAVIKLIGSQSNTKHAKEIIEWLILKWKPQVENQQKSDKHSKICGKPLIKQEEKQKMHNKFYCLTNTENISFSLPKSNYHEIDNVEENVFQSASVNNENQTETFDEEYFSSDSNTDENKSNNLIQWNQVAEREKWDASWVYETKNWNATIAEKVNKNVEQKQESSDIIAPAVRELKNNLDCSHERKCWNEDAKNNKNQNSNSEYFISNLFEPVGHELNPDGNIILSNSDVNKNSDESSIENLNKTKENKPKEIQNQDYGYKLCSYISTDSDGSQPSGENTSNSFSELNELVEHEKWDAGWIYKSKNWNVKTADSNNKIQEKKCLDIIQHLNGRENLEIENGTIAEKYFDSHNNSETSQLTESKSSTFLDQNQAKNLLNWNEVVEEEMWDATWIQETENWNSKIAEIENKSEKQEEKSADTDSFVDNESDKDNSDCNLTCNDEVESWNEDDIKSNNNQSSNTQYFSCSLTDSPCNDLDLSLVNESNDELLSENSNDSWTASENEENKTDEIQNQNKSSLEEYFVHELGSQNSTTASASLDESQSSQLSDENQSKNSCNSNWSAENKSRLTNYFYHDIGLADIILPISNVNKNNDELLSVKSKNEENKTEEIQKQNKSSLEEYLAYQVDSQSSTASTSLDESQSTKLSDKNQSNSNCNLNWSVETQSRLTNYNYHDFGLADIILPISNVIKNDDQSLSVNTNNTWSVRENEEKNTEEIQNQTKISVEKYFAYEPSFQNSTNSSDCNSNWSDKNEYCNEDLKSNEDEHSNSAYFSLSLNESVDMTTVPTLNVNNHEFLDENCENQKNECEGSLNITDSCRLNKSQDLDENKSEKQFKWIEVINKKESDTPWQDGIDFCEARLAEYLRSYKSEKQQHSLDATVPVYICNTNCSDKNVPVGSAGSVCQELDPDDRTILQTSNVHKNNQESPNIYCEEYLNYKLISQNSLDSNHSSGSQFSKLSNKQLSLKELTEHEKWVSEWIDVSENWKDNIAEGENENKKEEKEFLDSAETVYMELGDAKADHNPNRSDKEEYEFALHYENETKNNYEIENWYYSWSQSESCDTDNDKMQSPGTKNNDKTNKIENSYLNINQSNKLLDENKLSNFFEKNEQVVQKKLSDVWIQENETWNIETEEKESKTKTAEKESLYCELGNEENECCDQDLQTESVNKNNSFKFVSVNNWDNISSKSENSNNKTEELQNKIETNDQEIFDYIFEFYNTDSCQANEIQVNQPISDMINVLRFGCNSEKNVCDKNENEDRQQKISNYESDDKTTLKNPNVTCFKWSDLVAQEENKIQIEKIVRSFLNKSIHNEYWKSEDETNKITTTQQTQFGLTNSIYQNSDIKEHFCSSPHKNFLGHTAKSKWIKMMEPEFNVDHQYELLLRSYKCKKWSNINKDCSNKIVETENSINTNQSVAIPEEHFSSNKSNFSKLETGFTSYSKNFPSENIATSAVQCNLALIENCYKWRSSDNKNWNNCNEETENKNNLFKNMKTEIKSIFLDLCTESYLMNSNESDSGKILPNETASVNEVQSNWNKICEEQLTADQEYELMDENNDKSSTDSKDWNNPNEKTENKNNSIEMVKTEMNFNFHKSISPESAIDFTSHLINLNEMHSEEILPETTSANEVQCNWNKISEEKQISDQEYELMDENSYKWSEDTDDWINVSEKTENDSIENLPHQEDHFSSPKSVSPESATDFTSYLISSNEINSEKILPETTSANEVQCNWDKITELNLISDQEYELLDENSYDKWSNDTENLNNSSEETEPNLIENLTTQEHLFSFHKSDSPESRATDFTSYLINSNEIHSEEILPETTSANEVQCNWNKISEEKQISDQEYELMDENSYKWSEDTDDWINVSEKTENNSIKNLTHQEDHFSFHKSDSPESRATDFTSYLINLNETHSEEILPETTSANEVQCNWNKISEEKQISDQEYELMDENSYKWSEDTDDWINVSEKTENDSIENLPHQEDHFSSPKSVSPESATDFTSYLISSNEINSEKILPETTSANEVQCNWDKITELNLISDQEYELLDENSYDKWSNDTENLNNSSEETEPNLIENLTTQEHLFSFHKSDSPESRATDFTSYLINSNEIHSEEILRETTSANEVQCNWNKIMEEKQISDQEYEQMDENSYKWSEDTDDWINVSEKTENNSIENLPHQEDHFSLPKSVSPESATDFTSYLINSNEINFENILPETTSANEVQCNWDKTSELNLISEQEYELMDENSYKWSEDTDDWINVSEEIKNNSIENLPHQEDHFSLPKSVSPESTTDFTSYLINSNKIHFGKKLPENTSTNAVHFMWGKINEEKLIFDQDDNKLMDENCYDNTEDWNNSSEETKNNSIENLTTQEHHSSLHKSVSPKSAIDFTSYLINLNEIDSEKILPENTSTNAVQCMRGTISEEKLITDQEYELIDESCYDKWSNDTEDCNNPSGETENKNNSSIKLTTQEEHFNSIKSISPKSTTDFTSCLINLNENSPTNEVQYDWNNVIEEKLIADQWNELLHEYYCDKVSNITKDWNNQTVKIESKNNAIKNLATQEENFSLNKSVSLESITDFTSCLLNSNEMHSEKILNENSVSNKCQCDWKEVIGEKLIVDQGYDDIKDWINQAEETENQNNLIENETNDKVYFSSVKFSSPNTKSVYEKFFGKLLIKNTSMNAYNEIMESRPSSHQESSSFDDNLYDIWSTNIEDCSKNITKTENNTQEAHFLQLNTDKDLEFLENSNKTSPGKTSINTIELNLNELIEDKLTNEIKDSSKKIVNTENKCKDEESLSFNNSFGPVLDISVNLFDENKTPNTSCCDWNNMIELDESVNSRCMDKFSKNNESFILDTKEMDAENKKNKDEVSIRPITPNNDDIACGSGQMNSNLSNPIDCNVINETEEKICDNKKVNAQLKNKQARPAKRRKKKKRYTRR